MNVTVISPQRKDIIAVAWLEIQTDVGSFVIQQGHAPTILMLSPNQPITMLLKSGKQETIPIKTGGVVEIQRESVNVLLNE